MIDLVGLKLLNTVKIMGRVYEIIQVDHRLITYCRICVRRRRDMLQQLLGEKYRISWKSDLWITLWFVGHCSFSSFQHNMIKSLSQCHNILILYTCPVIFFRSRIKPMKIRFHFQTTIAKTPNRIPISNGQHTLKRLSGVFIKVKNYFGVHILRE